MASGKTVTLNATGGKVICNTNEGTAAASNISLYTTTTGSITMGGLSSGITMDDIVKVNTLQGTAATSTISLYDNITTTAITVGAAQTSGTMRIGNATAASDSGTLTINKTTTIASSKTLTTGSISAGAITASSVQCNTFTAPGGFVFGTNASQGAGSTVNNNYRFLSGGYYVVYSFSTGEVSYSSSSITKKYDVITAERDWDSVLNIRPVEYTFITDNVRRLGAIAEEVFDINPDFAIFDHDPAPGAIDWFNIIVYQNQVIKENRQRIETLETDLAALKAMVLAMQP